MTKQELIATIAKKAGLTKADTERAIAAFTDTVVKAAKKGDKVTLVGFGTFSRVKRKARKGVNPKTKEPMKIPASKSLRFKPSPSLKKQL